MSDDAKGLKVECYFDGESLDQIVAQLNEYQGDPTRNLKILKGPGGKRYLQASTSTDGGDPINDSHPCPGSPGCP